MFKKIIISIITIAIIIGGYVAYKKYFKPHKAAVSATATKDVTEGKYDDEIPIFTDVPLDKVWEFAFDRELDENTINSNTIKIVSSETQKEEGIKTSLSPDKKKIVINPPDNKYQKGTTYELHIKKDIKYVDGSNVNNPYDAEFITVRDEVEKGTLNKNLVFLKKEQIESISGNTIKVSKSINEDLKKGVIIIIPTKEHPNGQAFKIVEIDKGLSSNTLTVEQPKFAELFDELNIYKTYEISPENIKLEKGIKGVKIENVSMASYNTLISSSNGSTGTNEFQLPNMHTDFSNGFRFSFDQFQLGNGNAQAFLSGDLSFAKPKVSTDINLGFMKIKTFNLILKNNQDHNLKVTLPVAQKNGEKIIYKDTTKKKLKKLTERIKLAQVDIPIPEAPGVFIEGSLYIKATYDFSYQPEASVTFEFDDERGVVYNGKEVKAVKNTTSDLNLSIKGSGKLEARLGAAANMGITAFGVLGGGVEAFGGGKGTGEFFNGVNNDFGNFFCMKGSYNAVVEGSVFVDVLKERWYEKQFAEFNIPPKFETDNCQIFQDLNLSKKKLTMKPGETVEIVVNGKYVDISTQKSSTKELTHFDQLNVLSSDDGTIQATKNSNKIILKVPEYPSSEKASVTLEYKERGEIFEKDIKSKIEIPITLTNVPKALPKNEVKKIMTGLYSGIVDTFNDLGKKYNWSNQSNPPKFNLMEPELLKYATPKLTNGKLKTASKDYYCQCDYLMFPYLDFDIRFTIHENTSNKIVASGIEFLDEIGNGGGTFYLTAVRDKGKWAIDDWKWVSAEDEDMKVTWKEYQAYEKKHRSESGTLVNTVTYKGKKVYVVTYGDLNHKGVYSYSTEEIFDVPNEWLPKNLQVPESNTSAGPKEAINYQISPDGTATANIPKNGTLRVKVGDIITLNRTGSMEAYDRILLSAGAADWGPETGIKNTYIINAVKPGTSALSILPLNDWELEYKIDIVVE